MRARANPVLGILSRAFMSSSPAMFKPAEMEKAKLVCLFCLNCNCVLAPPSAYSSVVVGRGKFKFWADVIVIASYEAIALTSSRTKDMKLSVSEKLETSIMRPRLKPIKLVSMNNALKNGDGGGGVITDHLV
ncbi:hypothetical protein PVK06_042338 [Gossypium arboreum]|uniref:Uncharacterized protein n=1 Tax=Gossypium arboreum TaxID=29729 RepID=A0ABR0MKZ3_GOSAR|nr:hypothetical protein PVK06_042338 [Gossypium arboreum]